MKTAYFDCVNGAGGDMIVAALIDAGADADALRRALASLGVEGYALGIERVVKQGFAATKFHVELDRSVRHPHRHLQDLLRILEGSGLPGQTKARAARVFTRLAEAEAKVHGTTTQKVHFHEVGAVDALLDVVGAVAAVELLGIEKVVCSPIPPGSGTITCEHGTMPVPAPATAELLRGVPLAATEEPGELITPTAAAVLTTLAGGFGPIPSMTLRSVGYGAGSREGRTRPNVLRVLLGESAGAGDTDEVTLLETNIDDTSPEVIGYCIEQLFAAGALDVYTVPIQMKKSRSGVLLGVLCEHPGVEQMTTILFRETSTFGVRRSCVERIKLQRRHETVQTRYGPIRVKVGQRGGVLTVSPEFDDCRAAALRSGAALRVVVDEARARWMELQGRSAEGGGRCPTRTPGDTV